MTNTPEIERTPVIEVRMDKHIFRELAVHISSDVSDEHRAKFLRPLNPDDTLTSWPYKRYYWLAQNGASLALATSFMRALPDGPEKPLWEVARCEWHVDDEAGPGPSGYVLCTDYLA